MVGFAVELSHPATAPRAASRTTPHLGEERDLECPSRWCMPGIDQGFRTQGEVG